MCVQEPPEPKAPFVPPRTDKEPTTASITPQRTSLLHQSYTCLTHPYSLTPTTMANIMQEVTINALPISNLLSGETPQLRFPRQVPILLHGRVSQSEFEQVLLLAENPFNQALTENPVMSGWGFLPCCLLPKLVQLQSEVLDASRQATDDIAAESARTFEPRGVQFSFVEGRSGAGKHSRTEYSIVARVMPGASSTMVDTSVIPKASSTMIDMSVMPPPPYAGTPTSDYVPLSLVSS